MGAGQKNSGLDATTYAAVPSVRHGAAERLVALTIAAHPDLSRVGQRVFLRDMNDGHLSRAEPEFEAARGLGSAPLADGFVSRKPLRFSEPGDGAVRIERGESNTKVIIDGEPLAEARTVDAAAIDNGAVIRLAHRVVLVLHRQSLAPCNTFPEFDMVGESDAVQEVRSQIAQVADLAVPVLIRGKSGSGKELVARAIHFTRCDEEPFVAINMAALASGMAASELFGHVKGAFTGATRDHPGHFVRADGGTLFLDEIGDAPSDVQAMLLRVLETSEVVPVGGSATRRVNVRLIAATDADLEEAVEDGSFRLPLFHRLASYQIDVAPLCRRRSDIGRLVVHLLKLELTEIGEASRLDPPAERVEPWLPAGIVERMVRHDWPGNVRQLRNAVRHLVIASRGLDAARLDSTLQHLLEGGDNEVAPELGPERTTLTPGDIADDTLIAALRDNGWRVGPTAEALGIARSSLYRLIDRSSRIRKAKAISSEELAAVHAEHGGDVRKMAAQLEVSPRALRLRMRDVGLG